MFRSLCLALPLSLSLFVFNACQDACERAQSFCEDYSTEECRDTQARLSNCGDAYADLLDCSFDQNYYYGSLKGYCIDHGDYCPEEFKDFQKCVGKSISKTNVSGYCAALEARCPADAPYSACSQRFASALCADELSISLQCRMDRAAFSCGDAFDVSKSLEACTLEDFNHALCMTKYDQPEDV